LQFSDSADIEKYVTMNVAQEWHPFVIKPCESQHTAGTKKNILYLDDFYNTKKHNAINNSSSKITMSFIYFSKFSTVISQIFSDPSEIIQICWKNMQRCSKTFIIALIYFCGNSDHVFQRFFNEQKDQKNRIYL